MSHRQLKHKSTELDDSQSVCAVYVAQHPPATLALRAKRGRDRRKHVLSVNLLFLLCIPFDLSLDIRGQS